jgi:tetratricopeptide (TPR) repeat protein
MFPEAEQPSPEEQTASREAHLLSLEQGPDAALLALSGRSDPESIARQLGILIEHNRLQEAQRLLGGREPHARWAHLAAYALARCGDVAGAERAIASTKALPDRVIQQRAVLSFAHGSVERIVARSGNGNRLLRGMLTGDDRALVRRSLDALRNAFAFDQLQNPLEEYACSLALTWYLALNEKHDAERLAKLLEARSPVPLPLADAVLAGGIPAPENLPARLRSEHPQSFDAKLKAALIEGKFLGRPGPGLAAAIALKEMQLSREERSELLRALVSLADAFGSGAQGLVDSIIPELVNPEDPEGKLFQADRYLRDGDLDAAEALLEGAKDETNPTWLQAAAFLREQRGDVESALALFERAAVEHPHPALLRHAAAFAYQHGRLGASANLLERLAMAEPDDLASRRNLALVYGQMGDFERAATHFRVLRQAQPQESGHALRLAVSLALADQPAESLAVYEDLCARPEAPLEAHLGRSRVLIALNRPGDACEVLEGVRDRFWSRPEFLLALMGAAYAADREDLAGPALRHLAELQAEEAEGEEAGGQVLQTKTLDELKAYLMEQREFHEGLQWQVLRGTLPWLIVEPHAGGVPYFGWARRTQPLPWVHEDPLIWAAHSVYATNGFTVVKPPGGRDSLVPISYTNHTRIAADMTALITLHRLGLLGRLGDRFREILVPAVYFAHVLEERVSLRPHQLSRRNASALLSRAIGQGKLLVWEEHGEVAVQPLPRVEEYSLDEENGHLYRLIDVADTLYEAGMFGETEYARLRVLAHRPSADAPGQARLSLGDRVLCQLRTLETLAAAGLLDPVLEGFAMHITPEERAGLKRCEAAYRFQEQVATWHTDLWRQLADQTRFMRVAVDIPRQWQEEAREPPRRAPALEAAFVAVQYGVPLLTDDRCCQMLVLNQEGATPSSAFGTDQLLSGLLKEGLLTVEEATQAFLQVMRWRYRFLFPPVPVLVECAHSYRKHPPGRQLQEVARYVHDSMRDPGLFNGPERTDPPVAMAVRLAEAWAALAGEFVVGVWADERFTEESARKLTRWAVEDLLPSSPRTLPLYLQRMLAMLAPTSALSGALTQSLFHEPSPRTRQGFQALRESLGMSEERYRRAVTEVIDGFWPMAY